MTPPIFTAANVSAVKALLKTGNGPLRFYAWGLSPQPPVYPYAVWRFSFGAPENYLTNTPDIDSQTLQVNVYAADVIGQRSEKARQIAEALRDAIEPLAHITAWRGESRDPDTRSYVFSFDVDWWVNRPVLPVLLLSGDAAPGSMLLSGDMTDGNDELGI